MAGAKKSDLAAVVAGGGQRKDRFADVGRISRRRTASYDVRTSQIHERLARSIAGTRLRSAFPGVLRTSRGYGKSTSNQRRLQPKPGSFWNSSWFDAGTGNRVRRRPEICGGGRGWSHAATPSALFST